MNGLCYVDAGDAGVWFPRQALPEAPDSALGNPEA
jgi:hypothetical protein